MKIVLTDKELNEKAFSSDVDVIRIVLKELGRYNQNRDVIAIAGSRAMAIEAAKMDFPCLKLFQLTSAGFDDVPIEEYRKKGIAVTNAGSVYSVPIAETVILGMLLMAKRLHRNPNNRHPKFTRHYDSTISELMGKRILIMGTGSIGTAIANRLYGFEADVDGYNRSATIKPGFSHIITGREELMNNIGRYDYIISTLPDTDETRGFINYELLSKMSANAVIVNVGRKAVFNEDDLYIILKSKKIKGAVLDMFERIPNPLTNRYRRLRNVIVLPGVAAVSKEVNERLKDQISSNIIAVIKGNALSNVINGV